jgi:two-component system, cell cycle sensor histidine kinase and response regulator CckA
MASQSVAHEVMYRAVAAHTRMMIVLIDSYGRIRSATPGTRGLLGYEMDDVIGRLATDFVHPDDVARVQEALGRVARTHDAVRLDLNVVRRDRTTRILQGSTEWIDSAEFSGAMVVLEDVTDERLTTEALRVSEARLRGILDGLPINIGLLETDGRIIVANKSAIALIGATHADVVGKPFPDTPWWHDEAERGQLRDALQRAASGETVKFEAHHYDTTRRERVVDFAVTPMRDESGKVRFLLAASVDVTERVEAMEELLRSQQHLEQAQKLEAIGRLAGAVSHDFNNVLTAILSFSEMIMHDLPADAPQIADVEQIHKAAERGSALTRQLLAFSRSNVVVPKPVDVAAKVNEMYGMLRRLVPEDVHVDIEASRQSWLVLIDPSQLEQVVMNLVINARDALRPQGHINIRVEDRPARPGDAMSDGTVTITVRDDGSGMNEETLKHLFEPFFTTKGLGKGTGLGLSVVYGIVKQARGKVNVRSEVGVGTEFAISLPRFVGEAPTQTPAQEDPDTLDGRETILLVEDQDTLRAVARRVLERHGYTVVEATDGAAAFAIMRERDGKVDLLVSDLVMPRMGGRELVERLRAAGYTPPTIIMSGYSEQSVERARLIPTGAAFLDKPFTSRRLAIAVRRALDGHTVPTGASS